MRRIRGGGGETSSSKESFEEEEQKSDEKNRRSAGGKASGGQHPEKDSGRSGVVSVDHEGGKKDDVSDMTGASPAVAKGRLRSETAESRAVAREVEERESMEEALSEISELQKVESAKDQLKREWDGKEWSVEEMEKVTSSPEAMFEYQFARYCAMAGKNKREVSKDKMLDAYNTTMINLGGTLAYLHYVAVKEGLEGVLKLEGVWFKWKLECAYEFDGGVVEAGLLNYCKDVIGNISKGINLSDEEMDAGGDDERRT